MPGLMMGALAGAGGAMQEIGRARMISDLAEEKDIAAGERLDKRNILSEERATKRAEAMAIFTQKLAVSGRREEEAYQATPEREAAKLAAGLGEQRIASGLIGGSVANQTAEFNAGAALRELKDNEGALKTSAANAAAVAAETAKMNDPAWLRGKRLEANATRDPSADNRADMRDERETSRARVAAFTASINAERESLKAERLDLASGNYTAKQVEQISSDLATRQEALRANIGILNNFGQTGILEAAKDKPRTEAEDHADAIRVYNSGKASFEEVNKILEAGGRRPLVKTSDKSSAKNDAGDTKPVTPTPARPEPARAAWDTDEYRARNVQQKADIAATRAKESTDKAAKDVADKKAEADAAEEYRKQRAAKTVETEKRVAKQRADRDAARAAAERARK